MDAKSLAKAKQNYNIQKRLLAPERWVALDVFRDLFPEDFPRMMMPAPAKSGESPKAGRPGGMPDFAVMAEKAKVLAEYLAGEKFEDTLLQKLFGFTNAELEACLKANDPIKIPLPAKMVLMTFDDSTIDHYTVACPLLEKYGGKANLFTTEMESGMFGRPGFADKTAFMTWEQIKELSDREHEVVNHSWHHSMKIQTGADDYIMEEIHGIEKLCVQYGIPKPTCFGAPGGGFTRHIEEILHKEGYLWGRGDLKGIHPEILGEALYDPYVDTPLVIPNCNPTSIARLREILDSTVGGKVALFVFHNINDKRMMSMPFEDIVKGIYEYGGRCITFRELTGYVDPLKAYAYTH